MDYAKFLKEVKVRAGVEDPAEAERTALVILQTLVDRLTPTEADDLVAQLPEPLKSSITLNDAVARLDPDEFVERVARELEITPDEAHARIHAVFSVLRDAVTPGELHDVLVQLPSGYFEMLTAP